MMADNKKAETSKRMTKSDQSENVKMHVTVPTKPNRN